MIHFKPILLFIQEVVYFLGIMWLTSIGSDFVSRPDTWYVAMGAAILLLSFVLFVDLIVIPLIRFVVETTKNSRRDT
jgi:hypothetical protein